MINIFVRKPILVNEVGLLLPDHSFINLTISHYIAVKRNEVPEIALRLLLGNYKLDPTYKTKYGFNKLPLVVQYYDIVR